MIVYPDKINEYVSQNLCDENEVAYETVVKNRERLKIYMNWLDLTLNFESKILGNAFNDRQAFIDDFISDKEKKRWSNRDTNWKFQRLYKKMWFQHDYNWYLWQFWIGVMNNVEKFKYEIYTNSSNLVLESKVVKPLYKAYRKKVRIKLF